MTINPYFNLHGYDREQDLLEDLVVESIKIYGIDVKYLPRTLIENDSLFGEDTLSAFNEAVAIEMYIKNTTAFEGEGDFLSHYNLEIRDQVTFTMARKRWPQITTEKLATENGFLYQLESANTDSYGDSSSFLMEDGNANGYSLTSSRPIEGDLIYFPLNSKLYEIKFVEHEEMFYPHGKLYTYDITCELFQYSSQTLATGNTVIDAIETEYSADILVNRIDLEDGNGAGFLLGEDDGYLLIEYRVETTDRTANNELYGSKALEYIDFSEQNPFSELDRY